MGVPYLGGRRTPGTSYGGYFTVGTVLSFYGPWGWGGGGRGLWHPHTPRKLRLGNRLYDLCAFGARLSHFPFKFTALGVINEGVGAS